MTSTAIAATRPAAALPRVVGVVAVTGAGLAGWIASADWPLDQRLVLVALSAATGAWIATRLDDTVVALIAAVGLAVSGAVPDATLFGALGSPTIWLLVGACMLAAGLTASGLTERAAGALVGDASTVRGLWHRTTLALIVTTFAVPATTGRAALAMPIFRRLARTLPRPHQVALSLLFPAVILLSAFASILGAGAHLVAANLIEAATGTHISFGWWILLGAPVAVVSAFLATEIVLVVFLDREQRRLPVTDVVAAVRAHRAHHRQRWTGAEVRALATLGVVTTLWVSEPWHGIDAALVAVLGGLISVLPDIGTTTAAHAFDSVPWSLLVFLAATLALGTALVDSGAADRIAEASLTVLAGADAVLVLVAIVAASAASHLLVQSRTARASVLLPTVLVVAAGTGLNPMSAGLASTAAAGFCLTLTSSAKPVAMFANAPGVATFDRRTLLVFASIVGPLVVAVTLLAAAWLWPLLGVPLTAPASGR